jgi:predicted DNA-binding protein (MmcQ/YjbR family)
MGTNAAALQAETTLRALCLGYPGAYEDHPWGDTVFKVKGKVFVFMGTGKIGFGISAKLPVSNSVALMLPFASPTGYGLGKSGWVSAEFGPKDEIPLDMLSAWIDESYRAVAPKKLVAELSARGAGSAGPAVAVKEGAKALGEVAKKGAKKPAAKPAKAGEPAAKPKEAAAKPKAAAVKVGKAAAKPKAAEKPKAAAVKPKAAAVKVGKAAAKPKAAEKPKAAAVKVGKAAAKAADKPAAKAKAPVKAAR